MQRGDRSPRGKLRQSAGARSRPNPESRLPLPQIGHVEWHVAGGAPDRHLGDDVPRRARLPHTRGCAGLSPRLPRDTAASDRSSTRKDAPGLRTGRPVPRSAWAWPRAGVGTRTGGSTRAEPGAPCQMLGTRGTSSRLSSSSSSIMASVSLIRRGSRGCRRRHHSRVVISVKCWLTSVIRVSRVHSAMPGTLGPSWRRRGPAFDRGAYPFRQGGDICSLQGLS
jgi:hypothetical protein